MFFFVRSSTSVQCKCGCCCHRRPYTDGAYDSDNELAVPSEVERSAVTSDVSANIKERELSPPVRTSSAAPDNSSAVDRGRLYCPSSDSCQLTTSSSTIRHHQQQQPYLSCWINHVSPSDFASGQTRHS